LLDNRQPQAQRRIYAQEHPLKIDVFSHHVHLLKLLIDQKVLSLILL